MNFPLSAKIGVGLVVYGILGLIAPHFISIEQNPAWWAQEFGVLLGGAGLLGWPLLSSVHLLKITKEVAHDDGLPHITTAEQVDFEALNHLAERLKEGHDKDGVDLCQKLSDRLFVLHHGEINA